MQKNKEIKDKISLVIPCYNEEDSLPFLIKELDKLYNRMDNVIFEVIFVDNCSSDGTLKYVKQLHEKNIKYNYISFSRNFGKDASMFAGLKVATGDYVVIMDADLQDPPRLVYDMYNILKNEDYDVVGTYRKDRKHEPFLRSIAARVFYNMINKMTDFNMANGARDFRMMKRNIVDEVLRLGEIERFTKGIFAWIGFKVKWLGFENNERVAGETKLPFKSAFIYAIKGIFGFSKVPLVAMLTVGLVYFFIMIAYLIYVAISHRVIGNFSLIIFFVIGFMILLLFLAFIGQYVWQMFLEAKKRPIYIVRETNLDKKKIY